MVGALIKSVFAIFLNTSYKSYLALHQPKTETAAFVSAIIILLLLVTFIIKLALFFKSRVNNGSMNEGGQNEKDLDKSEVKDLLGSLYTNLNVKSLGALNY